MQTDCKHVANNLSPQVQDACNMSLRHNIPIKRKVISELSSYCEFLCIQLANSSTTDCTQLQQQTDSWLTPFYCCFIVVLLLSWRAKVTLKMPTDCKWSQTWPPFLRYHFKGKKNQSSQYAQCELFGHATISNHSTSCMTAALWTTFFKPV